MIKIISAKLDPARVIVVSGTMDNVVRITFPLTLVVEYLTSANYSTT